MARVRATPVEVAWMVASTCGVQSAAPTPWTMRATISIATDGASAQATADTRKSPMPTT